MGYFNYKKPVLGSYLDRRNPPYLRDKSALGAFQARASAPATGDQYAGNRFNYVKDRLEEGSVLEDWIPRQPTNLHLMLRRIYARDAISGMVIDIFSTLPWGKSWELLGIDDPKIVQMYMDMVEALQIWEELPMICRELLIIGRNIGSLSFNSRLGYWDSLVPIDPDQARIQPVPVSGKKPLIDVLSSPAWREFARSVDPRVVEIKESLNPDTIALLQNQSGYIPLDPMNTLWLARRVNQYDHIGTSMLTRVLPAWAYEMALWNASLIGARRRNRSILLITAGIDESWEPTDEEISSLSSLFMQADEDPTGAVIAVRNGVEVSEVRDPTAIWGISQEADFLSTIKMRALGVSEAYISGETNVSNMEAARTSLGKQISAFKSFVLNEIFSKQLFPTFARIHNFQKRTQAEISHGIRTSGYTKAYISAKAAMNIPLENLIIPELATEDTLRPEQDTAYLDMLKVLKDEGLPVPLRIWASAAGYDIDKALAMMEEDEILKKRIAQFGLSKGSEGVDLGGGEDVFTESPTPAGGGEVEEASSTGVKNMIPPKWSVSSRTSKVNPQIIHLADQTLDNFKTSGVVKALKKISPRILADLEVPHDKILVPYQD